MENGGYMFVREQSGNNNNSSTSNNLAWENTWALSNHLSRFDLGNSSSSSSFLYRNTTAETTTNATLSEGNAAHALLFPHATHRSLYAGVGSNLHPDPHLMCLKLGKRHYFEDSTAAPMGQRHVDGGGGYSVVKKGKPYYTYSGCGDGVGLSSSPAPVLVTSTATVPRCQVDGCHVALINSKEYHRRHKVCEMHSKAPKVMVLGLEQRFCQQCSRFHVVSEFDDTKRSCRRRLAGHNERRRKSSHDSLSRNSSQVNKLVSGRLRSPATGRALSLLSSSSSKAGSWVSSSDLSSRCSAALRELIAENRAAILARHLILDGRDWNNNANQEDHPQTGSDSMTSNHHYLYQQHNQIMLTEQQPQPQQQQQQNNWERYQETNTHVTLDLMQAPSEEEEECSELWTSLEDDHVA